VAKSDEAKEYKMADERCPHCGARMVWINQVKDGKASRRLICNNEGICKLLREMKARTKAAKAG
jgi:transcription elongation factor Elf1